jgi:glyoxylase-like metal-dependent hydrolase (beta-lactamase superfamily II)
MCNCYIVYDDDQRTGIVIDPGDQGEVILEWIRKSGITIATIVDTHGHADHVAANKTVAEETGAKIAIHPADAGLLSNQEYAIALGIAGFKNSRPDILLDDGDSVRVGKESLTVVHTPGHTPGGICLIGDDMAFVGDTVFAGSIGRTDLPGGSFQTLISSINEKILVLDEETVLLPGHGPETTVTMEKQDNPFL